MQLKNQQEKIKKYIINKCQLVRQTCKNVSLIAKHVKINQNNITKLTQNYNYTTYNQFQHHKISQDIQTQLMYIFILDCLNFCFWPLSKFQYDKLAQCVQQAVRNKKITLNQLRIIDKNQVRQLIFNGIQVPLISQRTRILKQLAQVVIKKFNGKFINIIQKSQNSAIKLLQILTQSFPNFQDHSIYKGQQIHFYKRAQILIGDIYAKYQNKSIGYFYDINQLTMFPDYRVPQILNQYNILEYSQQLNNKIKNKQQIQSGSQMEIQIRACSVIAVEIMKKYIEKQKNKKINSIQVDWFLWEFGQNRLQSICQHHRTLTIYY